MPTDLWVPFLIFVGASFLCIEAACVASKHPTLSAKIWTWSKRWPLIPFAVGMICGHWFWCSCA